MPTDPRMIFALHVIIPSGDFREKGQDEFWDPFNDWKVPNGLEIPAMDLARRDTLLHPAKCPGSCELGRIDFPVRPPVFFRQSSFEFIDKTGGMLTDRTNRWRFHR